MCLEQLYVSTKMFSFTFCESSSHDTFWLDSSAIPIDLQLPRLINAEHQALFVKQFLEEQPNILYNTVDHLLSHFLEYPQSICDMNSLNNNIFIEDFKSKQKY